MYPIVVNIVSVLAVLAAGWVVWKTKMAVPFACAITVTKDIGATQTIGGNIWYIMEVTSAGAALGSPDTWHVLPHALKSKPLIDTDSPVELKLEDGAQQRQRGARKVGAEMTTAQVDAATLALKEETRGKFYKLYVQTGAMANGKVKEHLFGIVQIDVNINMESEADKPQTVDFIFTANKNASAITNANGTLPTVKKTASAMDIAANAYYFTAET